MKIYYGVNVKPNDGIFNSKCKVSKELNNNGYARLSTHESIVDAMIVFHAFVQHKDSFEVKLFKSIEVEKIIVDDENNTETKYLKLKEENLE